MRKKTSQKTQATHANGDDLNLVNIARPILERMESMWWCALTEQVAATILAIRNADDRVKVERAAEAAHKVASTAYVHVYKKTFAEAMAAQE